jgi:hypothetical protein
MYDVEKHVQSAISMFNEIPKRYEANVARITYCESARLDILHKLRDDKLNAIQMTEMTKLLKMNEKDRKLAKDENLLIKELYELCTNNPSIKSKLQNILGNSRNILKMLQNRTYTPRTNILNISMK